MQKNSITNKITPCCGLPFSVIYWWVSNLTLNSESDRQFIISKISQGGVISIDAWKVLINSGTLEADANLTKSEFLAWFDCGRQPNCEQLKIIIESYSVGKWTPEIDAEILALIDDKFDEIENNLHLGISEPAKTTNSAPVNSFVTKHEVSQFGTFQNWKNASNVAVTVTEADFNDNWIYFFVKDGKVIEVFKTAKPKVSIDFSNEFDASDDENVATMKATANFIENKILIEAEEGVSAPLPLPSANSFHGGLAQTTPFQFSGELWKIKIRALQSGTAKFQIVRKMTNNFPSPTSGNKEKFIGIKTFEITGVIAGIQEYTLPVSINVEKGDFLMWYSVSPETMRTAYGASDASPLNGWWQASVNGAITNVLTDFTYQANNGGLAIEWHIKAQNDRFLSSEDFKEYQDSVKVQTVKITATRNANNYNSIRDLIKGITDASAKKSYEIFVPDGEWFEFDLQGKKYVKIIGQSRDKTILYCDGNSTNPLHVAPTDFPYPAEVGKQIASINLIYKHVFFAKDDVHAENITIKQIAGKYCTHIDNANFQSVFFKNVRLISIDNSYPVGIGIWGGQSIVFEDFVIDYLESSPTTLRKLGFFIHNAIGQTKGTYFKAENGIFHGCGYGTIAELGSTQTDDWNFINCSTDSIGEFFFMVDVGVVGTYPNPRDVPYNIRLNTFGTNVDLVLDRPATNFPAPNNVGTQRPDFYKYIVSDYVAEIMPVASSGIIKGNIIALDNTSLPTYQRLIAKKTNDVNDIRLGIALENAVNGQKLRYTPLNKYAPTFVNGAIAGASYVNYRMKLNASFQLESAPTLTPQNTVGLALEAKGTGLGLHCVKILK